MEFKHVELTREGHVLKCKLSNPPLQVFTKKMMEELETVLGQVERDPSIRVFLVTGTDGVFIRWMDLNEMEGHTQVDISTVAHIPVFSPIHELGLRIQNLNAVTIAAINGAVGGGGCEFSLHFDFRLMSKGGPQYPEPVTFSLPQSSFGLVPGGGGAWHCIRLLGRAKALDVLLHGEFMSPEQALDLGLISRLYDADAYEKEVQAFVDNMAKRPPLALQGIKRIINQSVKTEQLDIFAHEFKELIKVMQSKDAALALSTWMSNPDPTAYDPLFTGE